MKKIEILIKPVSYDCNLNCGYCFYKKTAKLYSYKKNLAMKEDILEKLISKCMAYTDGGPCVFCWQGGEPLLAGINFFRKVIQFQKKYGKSGQVVSNSIQTNGTILNNEWTGLFKEYNFFIGVSLDGPIEENNYYRHYSTGRGIFQEVLNSIELLKNRKIDFNILTAIARDTAKDPKKLYNFFVTQELYYLQFIPAVDRDGFTNRMTDFSITAEQYGNFLCELFDVWWNDGTPLASIRLFDNVLEILLGMGSGCCMFKSQCGEYIVVEHNGDVYPCDFFVGKEWKVGNILEMSMKELFDKAKLQFGRLKENGSSDCQNCKWNFICHNGCLWHRWVKNGNIKDKDYFCESYKQFFSYTIKRFERLRRLILSKSKKSNRGIKVYV